MPTVLDRGVNIDFTKNFIRGAARILMADVSAQAFPTELNDVVRMAVTATNEVQAVTITGTPTGGTFTLSFKGYTTAGIAYNAVASAVQTALIALSSIGTGNVAVTGGPGPGTPWSVTFQGALAGQNVPSMSANGAGLTGGTTPAAAVSITGNGFGQYDAQANWTDLGATSGGITVLRNNSEETFEVDQIATEIASQPTAWEQTVSANLAQVDLDLLQYVWEAGAISLNASPTGGQGAERTLALGAPTSYRQKRLAVLYQRTSVDGGVTAGAIQAYCFRLTQKSPQESSIAFNKTGPQSSIPFTWRALADSAVVDTTQRFGSVIDQK